jgi:hypothetical protein
MVEQYFRTTIGFDKVSKGDCPPKMVGIVKQGMVQEATRKKHVPLHIRDEVEEEILILEELFPRTIIEVA